MAKVTRLRADEILVALGLAPTRARAQALVMAGRAYLPDGSRVPKAGSTYPEGTVMTISEGKLYASRGGDKLKGALDDLGIDPAGWKCLDLGASTGGFTDCLLKSGAASVCAVDVGRGLLDVRLREDPRVMVVEGQNARELGASRTPEELGGPFDLAVMDLSFISLTLVIGPAAGFVRNGGGILAMVKPQFESGRGPAVKKGVVRDPAAIRAAVDRVADFAAGLDPPLEKAGEAPSRVLGPKGNQEVFLHLVKVQTTGGIQDGDDAMPAPA
ncbi:MAG: TlyA family RNA methyltransferase [Deltaproteobacteria bacterium]|jgi:23S rRNA (cytidine1920-2'-O)/16S rRNA (cytidine1409-2'-O)-methyltransferase|nr:TlyA family RNA methyltransferase [Deltaproteobacteria bacterium]